MTVIITPGSTVGEAKTFRVVLLCDTPLTRTRGLQGFRQIKKDEAALFVFDQPQVVSFWMGSVSYPIDIVFVGLDRKVAAVFRNRKPGSPDIYSSKKAVQWVVETAAGSGIKAGDRISIQ